MISATEYGGWQHCYRLTNGDVEVVVTTDVGPRVIRCGFVGGRNLFKEFSDQLGSTGEPEWQPRGGHRLWLAPESVALSYAPDNSHVDFFLGRDVITLIQPAEEQTGFQKHVVVSMGADGGVEVFHQIRNNNATEKIVAPWALTMMAPGGVAVTAFPPRGTHPAALAPTNPLVMWGYTNFSDPRWQFTEKHLILRQDSQAATSVKAGLWNRNTCMAYLLGSDLFIKSTPPAVKGPEAYPDLGCSLEMFTNADFLELETLGPLVAVPPHGVVTHTERWRLHRDVHIDQWTDAEIERVLRR